MIDGSLRPARHGDPTKVKQQAAAAVKQFGPLEKPKRLKGDAKITWERWIEPAIWLDGSRGAAAEAFCMLWAEFMEAPRVFPAAKHAQLRGFMTDLGITDERKRGEIEPPKDEFFDD